MNKSVVLAFFTLIGMLVGLAMKQPAYGLLAGFALGLVSYLLLPEKKKQRAKKS